MINEKIPRTMYVSRILRNWVKLRDGSGQQMQQISTPIKPRTDMLTFYPVSLHHMTNLVNCLPFCLQNLFLTIFIKKIFIRSKYVTYLKYVSDKIVTRVLKKYFFHLITRNSCIVLILLLQMTTVESNFGWLTTIRAVITSMLIIS